MIRGILAVGLLLAFPLISNAKDKLEVLEEHIGEGKHSIVSLVRDKRTGEKLAMKCPRDDDESHMESFRSEIERVKVWREIGISNIAVRWADDGKCLLKTYVKGPTLNKLLNEFPDFLDDSHDKHTKALVRFLEKAGASTYYVGDINVNNLIFDGHEFQVIDSGGTQERSSPKKAAKEYLKKLPEKWVKDVPEEAVEAMERFFKHDGKKALFSCGKHFKKRHH